MATSTDTIISLNGSVSKKPRRSHEPKESDETTNERTSPIKEKKKKKKDKDKDKDKDKEHVKISVQDSQPTEDDTNTHKKKRKKEKETLVAVEHVVPGEQSERPSILSILDTCRFLTQVQSGVADGITHKRRKRKNRGPEEEKHVDPEASIEPGPAINSEAIDTADNSRKHKKRKRQERGNEGDDVDESTHPPKQTKKKRKHDDSPYPDPADDTALPDQNPLSYAFISFSDPSNWKFNKAKQNWLIRNAWVEETVPDKYVPLLARYLADVKGGARDKLIEFCNSVLVSVPPAGESTPAPTTPLVPGDDQLVGAKESRARILLDALAKATQMLDDKIS
ncbi:hypothetical protein BJ138DRAFT_1108569 [Hygrophoropsis aurantiaca]|uniref:Uncharacterized protein n=1 Tax=Hygrophoropsis aurantiaca TaxID=72124 RepID=A0ACB8ATG4_9AGAM|nr:hypothetical protein BJ138DRAFT_1108569 [Hygrophoropsis aurantiaca]